MLTPEQKEERRKGIGGSEIAAILGRNPWETPGSVWLKKKGLVDDNLEGNENIERGNFLEKAIVEWTGHRIKMPTVHNQATVHAGGILYATPDGYTLRAAPSSPEADQLEKIGLIEAKAPSGNARGEWEDPAVLADGVPEHYLLQTQWTMGVVGLPTCNLGAFLNGRLWVYSITFNADLFKFMVQRAEEWWDKHIVKEEEPPAEAPQDLEWIRRLHELQKDTQMLKPKVDVDLAVLTGLVHDFLEGQSDMHEAEDRMNAAKASLMQYIGANQGVEAPGWKVTWKQSKETRSINWEGLAKAFNPSSKQVDEFTVVRPGSRRFLAKLLESN